MKLKLKRNIFSVHDARIKYMIHQFQIQHHQGD
jgi:hypothetical protein